MAAVTILSDFGARENKICLCFHFFLDSVLKNRDITLLMKVHIVKALVFLGIMYGCESWTIKQTEC